MRVPPLARCLALVVLLPALAGAQEARRSGDATARLQSAVRQLTGEAAALKAENQRLAAQVADLGKELAGLKASRARLERGARDTEQRLARATTDQQAVEGRAEALQARLDEVVGKYRELAETLRGVEAEKAVLAGRAEADGRALAACTAGNAELAAVAHEALDRYERKGCFTAWLQQEPFTGISRSRIENVVDESRGRVESLTIGKAPDSSSIKQ